MHALVRVSSQMLVSVLLIAILKISYTCLCTFSSYAIIKHTHTIENFLFLFAQAG